MHIESFASRICGLLTMWVVDESCELCIEYEYALVGELSCTVSQLSAAWLVLAARSEPVNPPGD